MGARVVGAHSGEGVRDEIRGGLGVELVQADQTAREIGAGQGVTGGGEQLVSGTRRYQRQQLRSG